MTAALETGLLTGTALPAGQRAYYDQRLLDNLRTKSILVPFTTMKEDFRGRDTGQIVYSEVFDTEANWNPFTEATGPFLKGAYLDSRSLTIGLEIHGDVIKLHAYNELVNFWNNGDLRGLVDGKLGQNLIDHLDILARNAFLQHPSKYFMGKANRKALAQTDVFDPDVAELVRTHLEENEVPGVAAVADGEGKTIVCVTTPRVIHDIRVAAGSDWLDVNNYAGTGRKFTSEAGSWAGVRFVRTNRLRMKNHGAVEHQTTLNGAVVPGQGAAQTVDTVYTVGQSTSTRYIVVDDVTGMEVGRYITISDQNSSAAGEPISELDGTQETRRIVSVDVGNKRISVDKPFLKDHADADFVTIGVDVHSSIFMGGSGVVYAVGERPTPILLPVIDDLGVIRRTAWRGFLKMQLFRPEMYEVVESGGSVD